MRRGSTRSGNQFEGGRPAALKLQFLVRVSIACGNLSVHPGETTVVALIDLVPVDGVPPGLEILGTAVLVLEVVGVLPDVVAKYREARGLDDPGHQRVVLVRGGDNGELAVRADDHPGPAGAEPAHAGLVELGLQRIEPTEGVVDRLGDLTLRCATAAGAHDLPEHGV